MTEPTVDTTAEEFDAPNPEEPWGGTNPPARVTTDLVPAEQSNLFHTTDPVDVLERAARVAEALKGVIRQQGLVSNIQGREHVRVEGWTTLGSMLGVVPVVVWTRRIEDGWEARVEARTLDGRVVGAAEAMCSKQERTWRTRDDYALRSMAQTRATSKALRGPLGFVVTLAGYEATPAEEMPADASSDPTTGTRNTGEPSGPQKRKLGLVMRPHKPVPSHVLAACLLSVGVKDVPAGALESGAWIEEVNAGQMSGLIDLFQSGALPTGESDLPSDAPEFEKPAGDGGDDLFEPEREA